MKIRVEVSRFALATPIHINNDNIRYARWSLSIEEARQLSLNLIKAINEVEEKKQ